MKRLIILSTIIWIATILQGQSNAIDELFDKYSERDGFTTVYISSKLLGLFVPKDEEGKQGDDVIRQVKSIRILTVEDSTLNSSVNFYKELGKKMNFSGYEELMVVKEGNDISKFLIMQKGDIITELLVIVGGPSENVLISIKGDLDLKTISELSESTGINQLKDLEKIDEKKKD